MQTIQKWIKALQGYKTFIVSTCAVVYAITGYVTGNLTVTQLMTYLFFGAGASTLRAAIAKVEVYLPYLFDGASTIQDVANKVQQLQALIPPAPATPATPVNPQPPV